MMLPPFHYFVTCDLLTLACPYRVSRPCGCLFSHILLRSPSSRTLAILVSISLHMPTDTLLTSSCQRHLTPRGRHNNDSHPFRSLKAILSDAATEGREGCNCRHDRTERQAGSSREQFVALVRKGDGVALWGCRRKARFRFEGLYLRCQERLIPFFQQEISDLEQYIGD